MNEGTSTYTCYPCGCSVSRNEGVAIGVTVCRKHAYLEKTAGNAMQMAEAVQQANRGTERITA